MIGDKQEHFQGKGTDFGSLQSHIEEYLKSDGFTVQSSAPSARRGHPSQEGRLPPRSC